MIKFLFAATIAALASSSLGATKIACVGNSITYGYGLGNAAAQSYPARLQALLGTTGYSVQNDGVNSTTMTKNGDTPYWTKGKLAQVFSFQPDIVTIKLGTNDTKPQNWEALGYGTQFKKDYLAMIDTLAAMASRPKIFLVIPVPVFPNATGAYWGIRDSALQKEIPIIREVAAARGLPLIDANTPLKNSPKFFSVDGVHPDAAGEDTIAHIIYRAIIATSVNGPARRPGVPINKSGAADVSPFGMNLPAPEAFDVAGRLLNDRTMSGAEAGALRDESRRLQPCIVRKADKGIVRFR
jgi:lysophospholipase L1-like esterase